MYNMNITNTKTNSIDQDSIQQLEYEFKIGDTVRIKKINIETPSLDSEDYFYLRDFEKKIGTISEKNRSKLGKNIYKIMFNETKFGYFYDGDFELVE
jgi:hypothetical protein